MYAQLSVYQLLIAAGAAARLSRVARDAPRARARLPTGGPHAILTPSMHARCAWTVPIDSGACQREWAPLSSPLHATTLTRMFEEEQRHPFLSTPRALGACAREFVRLGDSIADGAADLFGDVAELKIAVRRSPERFIIQAGPAALTVAWIRSRRESAEGELLAIHWRGIVAPSVRKKPERLGEPTLSATAICEGVYFVDATSETDWTWCLRDEPARRYDSSSLAGALVDRLRTVHDDAAASPVPE